MKDETPNGLFYEKNPLGFSFVRLCKKHNVSQENQFEENITIRIVNQSKEEVLLAPLTGEPGPENYNLCFRFQKGDLSLDYMALLKSTPTPGWKVKEYNKEYPELYYLCEKQVTIETKKEIFIPNEIPGEGGDMITPLPGSSRIRIEVNYKTEKEGLEGKRMALSRLDKRSHTCQ